MENNKLLIGVQFTDADSNGTLYSTAIELYVLRDITLRQLLDGIRYGLSRLADEPGENRYIYERCLGIFSDCISKTAAEKDGRRFYTHLALTSYNSAAAASGLRQGTRTGFYLDAQAAPICELGFITSSRIIFDAAGAFSPKGKLNTEHIIPAFDPSGSDDIFFPEYNISTRQLYQFDKTPVDIIPPSDPPQKRETDLFSLLLPSIITIVILMLVRVFMTGSGSGGGLTMVILSAAMGLTAIVTTTLNWNRQNRDYARDLKRWRSRYQDYIDALLQKIRSRQDADVKKLDELYPDVCTLMKEDGNGVYSLNDSIYSRSANDSDFLTFRLGTSDDVPGMFEIRGAAKDTVFSEADFDIVTDNAGRDRVRLFLHGEHPNSGSGNRLPLCRLPHTVAERYSRLHNAPLLYSLADKSALGIVDFALDTKKESSRAQVFITRMIFELCYYHSPDDLQFVMFFDEEHSWEKAELIMNRYKFMPHFRGLFPDRSQFVFDSESAAHVMSSLLTLMNNRRLAADAQPCSPHIVFVVFGEHGLKEHAFAEYLPKPPAEGSSASNLGLTFIFAKKYKEYLPAYCDDIVYLDRAEPVLAPYENQANDMRFRFGTDASRDGGLSDSALAEYTRDSIRAFRFFSSIYYARIAQNGKVPSNVSMFELFGCTDETVEQLILRNWGLSKNSRALSVTESLRVPVGKTETGLSYLDLHEKADGPHMLVAGTTGSGKTETIITYLLGLCMQYRPDQLNLLLVDMKGGGFTKRLGHLPHVVGAVTDVDGDENGTGAEYMLGRFLNAMKAEIKRRKLLFNKLTVDSIDAYISACADIDSFIAQKGFDPKQAAEVRKTAAEDPLAHLILVVDEFTELKRFSSENSDIDFISEITTIARVGRSLGFHIILISQNIENAITDDIRVNSKSKLCLKVATRQASKEMIGTELAASPQMPGNGRAYLLVGAGSRFEYFQSGYSGAGIEEESAVEITLAEKSGLYRCFYRSDRDNAELNRKKAEQKKAGMSRTQLESVASAICSVYDAKLRADFVPHTVFRPPLPTFIALDESGRVVDLSKDRG